MEVKQDYEDILARVYEFIKPFVPEGQKLEEETDIVADLDFDSLKVMKLLEVVEDSFDVSIPINILPDIRTIKDFALQLQKITKER